MLNLVRLNNLVYYLQIEEIQEINAQEMNFAMQKLINAIIRALFGRLVTFFGLKFIAFMLFLLILELLCFVNYMQSFLGGLLYLFACAYFVFFFFLNIFIYLFFIILSLINIFYVFFFPFFFRVYFNYLWLFF